MLIQLSNPTHAFVLFAADLGGSHDCFVVTVGNSTGRTKTVDVGKSPGFTCPVTVSSDNWECKVKGSAHCVDPTTFTVLVFGNSVSASVDTSTTTQIGWEMDLQFKCCYPSPMDNTWMKFDKRNEDQIIHPNRSSDFLSQPCQRPGVISCVGNCLPCNGVLPETLFTPCEATKKMWNPENLALGSKDGTCKFNIPGTMCVNTTTLDYASASTSFLQLIPLSETIKHPPKATVQINAYGTARMLQEGRDTPWTSYDAAKAFCATYKDTQLCSRQELCPNFVDVTNAGDPDLSQIYSNLPMNKDSAFFGGGIMEIVDKGADGCKSNKKCGLCTGDCDTDADCNDGLKCYQRLKGEDTVPGCKPSGFVTSSSPHDYCYSPTTPHTNMQTFATPSTSYNAAKRKCQELGSWGLCSRMEICPEYKGSNNAGQPVKHGNAGDVWIPVSDGIDQWVQGGNNKGDKRMCRLHSEWPDYQKDPHPCGKHPDPKTYPDEASWYGFFCLLRPPCLLTVYLMPPRIL